ncbi:MAG: hypothetical protein AAFV53_19575, partial [Myxococcota bacterium]
LLVAATSEQWADARRRVQMKDWTVCVVPPIRDDELLALWLCQRPMLEDRIGERLAFPDLFSAIGRHNLREHLDEIGPDRVWFETPEWLSGQRFSAPRWARWRRRGITVKRVHRIVDYPLLRTESALQALLMLDDALSGNADSVVDDGRLA